MPHNVLSSLSCFYFYSSELLIKKGQTGDLEVVSTFLCDYMPVCVSILHCYIAGIFSPTACALIGYFEVT